MKNIVFGTVDLHGNCKPFYEERQAVKPRLVLTSVPFLGFRLPALRKAIRLGLFLENVGNEGVYEFPRLILTTAGDVPMRMRGRKFLYRVALNVMGGDLFMAQFYAECRVYPKWGTFLGTVDLEYPLFHKVGPVSVTGHWYSYEAAGEYYQKKVLLGPE